MTQQKLKKIIAHCCNDVIFTYNGKMSGITAEVHDSVPTFQVWHGLATKEYDNVNDVMNDKFYSGKSINDLVDMIDFTFA